MCQAQAVLGMHDDGLLRSGGDLFACPLPLSRLDPRCNHSEPVSQFRWTSRAGHRHDWGGVVEGAGPDLRSCQG
jgi:hypothetical protein